MKNSGYCLSLICLFISLCLYGCKDNAEESITEIFEIATEDLIQNFSKDAANVSISITTNLNVDNWEAKVTDKWLRATQFKNSLKISVDANIGSNRRTANVKVSSATKHYTITVTQYSASDIVIEEDIQVKPYAGKASEEETDPDRSIEHSFDNKFIADGGVPYHSKWGQSADFPVILEYYFEGNTDIDYFIYHTNSGNGTFGKFDVYTQTKENTEYVHQGSYDFNMRNSPSIASLKTPVKATKVKFEVHSGKNGYVSCDEMQFFKKNNDLSPEKREKVKAQLTQCGNRHKDVFAKDYADWVLREATGAMKLNRVAREILFTYCPLAPQIAEGLLAQNAYRDAARRYMIEKGKREKEINQVLHRFEKAGMDLPEEVEQTRRFVLDLQGA